VPDGRVLGTSERPLAEAYDLAMLDLDGVVYIGGEAVPGAAEHLERARKAGVRIAFITNNASRPADDVAAHLRELGVEARTEDVVTSAQAAARLLRDRFGEGAAVALLGGPGLDEALRDEGLEPVAVSASEAVAVVSGYGPKVLWRDIMRAAVRVRDGLPWVASNTDLTIPTPFGTAPGHGVLVGVLREFSRVDPVVAGKPERPLFDETFRRVGGEHPLMVGDRLDTDIDGALNAGCDSLLVMTGVTGLAELVAVPSGRRPTYVAADLAGLLEAQPTPGMSDGAAELGGWRARVESGSLGVEGNGSADDWWRAVAAIAWAHLDSSGEVADTGGLEPPGAGSAQPDG
jgi:HAD superfamily hydrolase (TIGR01450 family)